MAKGQMRKTKEARKPKKDAKKPATTAAAPTRIEPARIPSKKAKSGR